MKHPAVMSLKSNPGSLPASCGIQLRARIDHARNDDRFLCRHGAAACGLQLGQLLKSQPVHAAERNQHRARVPAPGSTGTPDNLGVVVLGSTAALPSGFQAVLANNTTGNTVTFNLVGTAPNPLPTPNSLPAFANPVYQSSGSPGVTFVAGSTISVYLNNVNSGCVPTTSLGSFRVQ
jgi:hypothetical protein